MKKALLILLALAMLLFIPACGQTAPPASGASEPSAPAEKTPAPAPADTPAPAPADTPTPAPTEPPAPTPDAALPVSVYVLSGTTGFGMANLICAAQRGEAALNYSFSVESDASNVTAALLNGSADIACLPTNAASALYNKTSGAVQVLALNTLGVLYLLSDGSVPVSSLSDLEGQTVYVPAQNPSFIFAKLCAEAGVNVTIDNSYAQPAELNAAVAAKSVPLAVLPEPLVTIARSQNPDMTVALDLTVEWDKVAPAGSLVQGCAVVRRAFAEAHPTELAAFLDEYGDSISSLQSDPETGAQSIETAGVFAKAAIAKKAIPNCNLCFITGADMIAPLGQYLTLMWEANPNSVGGTVPGDDFYYVP